MSEQLVYYRDILRADCTLDGKNIKKEGMLDGPDHHMFVILTSFEYNKLSESVLALPISSLKGNEKVDYFRMNYGVDISQNDIDGSTTVITKESVVLCDRPCRVDKRDFRDKYDDVKVTREKMNQLKTHVQKFIETGVVKVVSL